MIEPGVGQAGGPTVPHAVELPSFVARPPVGPYRRLNPTTKLVVAFAEALIAFGVRGWTGPIAVLATVLACAIWARNARSFLPYLLATIPLVISILLINTFLFTGATDVIVNVGPLAPTWSGLTAALQATLRVVGFAMSVALFALTTGTDELVTDLERRGVGRRPIFVIGTAIGTVPRMLERAREITDAQRARGLDTEGRIWRRIRGLVPLAGPLVIGALTDVEEQAMALEARAFTAPGHRTVLRPYPDSAAQRGLRWAVFAGTIALLVLSVSGALGRLP
jgi:energy-coupling factor transport system permease protein